MLSAAIPAGAPTEGWRAPNARDPEFATSAHRVLATRGQRSRRFRSLGQLAPLTADPAEADRIVLFEHRADIDDIEDGINQMLGRDPQLHRPPRLSWGKLIAALADAGIAVTESELIQLPLKVELLPEVEPALAPGE